jgi:hypothetical protein
MATESFHTCPECGAILAGLPMPVLCETCAASLETDTEVINQAVEPGERPTVDAIAAGTGLQADRVRAIVLASPLLRTRVKLDTLCERCDKRPAQSGETLCVNCKLDLNHALNTSADALHEHIERTPEQPPEPEPDRTESIERKRNITGLRGDNPTPRGRYS